MKKKQSKRRSVELPPNYNCPANMFNMDCNACGGVVCGQREIPRADWLDQQRRRDSQPLAIR